ncbi:GNAT family protein [Flavobacterium sp.]|uniref:GNAT family N-acetyltransferase n=1 Tax=Flavobacterium sp. TaxID=239 RepID=UPI0025BD0954|nr:GNAT family protein [Flavobacterium sp.]
MEEKYLKSLIQKLNRNNNNELIHLRPLSSSVEFAKVWVNKPKLQKNISDINGPYNFYFIKNEDDIYVSNVLDMGSDLHWFVDKKFRRNGYLTKALREIILSHLFQDRNEQRITIDKSQIGEENSIASENVAVSLGFKKLNEKEFLLSGDNYCNDFYIDGINSFIPEEKIDELKNRIKYLAQSLKMIQSEVEMKLGLADYVEELEETVKTLNRHAIELKEIWFEQNPD